MIATFSRNSGDRIAADRQAARDRTRVRHDDVYDDFCETLADPIISLGVINAADASADRVGAIVDRVARRLRPPALLLVHGLADPGEVDVLVEMALRIPYVQSAYRKYHELEVCLRGSPLEWVPCATPAIVRALCSSLDRKGCRILACCVAEAERHTTVPCVAAAAGTTEDAVREMAKRLGFRDWCEFRAWIRTLHAIHRMQKSEASTRLAAVLGGFQDDHTLENHTLRTLRHTPKQLVQMGFDRLVRLDARQPANAAHDA